MNRTARSQQPTRLQRATTAAFLLLAGVVLLAGLVTYWECYQLPSLGIAWTLSEGIVNIVEPASPVRDVVRVGDQLLALNGLPFVPGGDMMRLMHTVRPGQPVPLTIRRAGLEQTLTIVPGAMDPTLEGHLVDYVGGGALWILGLYVFLKRRTSTTARLFLLACLATSTALWGNVSLFVDPWYAALRRLTLSLVVPGLFLNVAVSLPYDQWVRRPAFWLRLVYGGLSLLLGLVGAVGALLNADWGYPLYLLILGNLGVGFAVGVVLVVLTHRELPPGAARDRYRGAVTFLILGGLPFIVVIIAGFWEAFRTFDTRLAALAVLALPLALAYVVLRYQFLGIRVAARQGLTVVLTLTSTAFIFLFSFTLVCSLLSLVDAPYVNELAFAAAALSAALLFDPLLRAIQRQLRHFLDRRHEELYEALSSFSHELVTLQDLSSLLDSLSRRLELLFPRTRTFIALRDEAREHEGYRIVAASDSTRVDPAGAFSLDGALAQRLRQGDVLLSSQWVATLEHLPPEERGLAERLQPEIVIPLLARGGDPSAGSGQALLGWIALGARGGSGSYEEDEIRWLVGLINQASVAIANAQLYDQTARVVAQLQETNRQLAALQEIGVSLTGRLSLREVLERVAQGVLGGGNYALVALGIANEARTAFQMALYRHADPQAQAQIESLIGRSMEHTWLELRDEQHPAIRAARQGQTWKFSDLRDLLGPAWDFANLAQDSDKAARVQQTSGIQTYVLLPLRVGEDLVGMLVVGTQRPDVPAAEIEVLRTFAYQAALAIENAQLNDQTDQMVAELQESNRQLIALQEIGASVTGHLPLREVLERVIHGVLGSGNYSVAVLGMTNEARAAIEVVLHRYADPQVQAAIESFYGRSLEGTWLEWHDEGNLAMRALRQGQIWTFHDIQGFAGSEVSPDQLAELQRLTGNQTYVLLPLRVGEDLVGILVVGTQRPDVPAAEIEALRTFVYQAAVAIENARLWEETDERLRQRVRELTTLNAIAEAVNSTLDLDEVLDRALNRTLAVTRFDTGLIALLDERKQLQLTISRNVPPPILDRLQHLSPDAVEQVLHTIPVVVDDIETATLPWDRSVPRDAGLRAFCIVPLVSRENLVGMLGLGIRQEQTLSAEDLAMAEAVAQQVGIAIANARLYEEAAEEKQKTEIVLQSVGDGVCTTDRDLILLSLNPAAERVLGWPEPEAIGRPCREVLQCHDAEGELLCETACPLRTAMQRQQYEYAHLGVSFVRRRSGQSIPIWGVAGPLSDPNRPGLGGVFAFRDASYEAEMERLQSEFISMISHEVRAPLTNLKAAAQTFTQLMGKQSDDISANLARIIAGQCDRLDQLVQRVEDSVQFQMGHLGLRIAPLHLPIVAREVVQPFRLRENQRVFELLFTDEAALWGLGDAEKIGMVLTNLLDNAAKYSQPRGVITVQLRLWDPAHVLVCVLDAGPRIPVEQRERIFERFYRVDNTDSRTVYGLGLGLYIARALVEAQGGRIWVDEGDGPGNRFCFTLPRSAPQRLATVAARPASTRSG